MAVNEGLATIRQREEFTDSWAWIGATQPVDLTGAKARLECRTYVGNKLLFAFDSVVGEGEGLITLGGVTGTIDISMSAEKTGELVRGGPWDLVITLADGSTHKFNEGIFVIEKTVTKGD